jgi:hypothetical protein
MKTITAVATTIALLFSALPALAVEPEEGPVRDSWARTDLPVLDGLAARTWMWGPEAITEPMVEPYVESPSGLRPVQYFDKSRMEITDPSGDSESPWYVTNGLLVVEMVEGYIQIGNGAIDEAFDPAQVNIAGDPGQHPTYADIATFGLPERPAREEGALVDEWFGEDGITSIEPNTYPDFVNATQRVTVPGIDHTIAEPFWEFMNSTGLVYEDGQYVEASLFLNPYYATGYPITEAYWSTLEVGGTPRAVLWQCFERRCLTHTPDNPEGFVVEAGNVGLHYYAWRYTSGDPEPPEPEPGETLTIDVSGLEIDAGDTEGDTTYGLRFVGVASGGLDGAMEVSLDYTPPNPGPGVVNQIVGGEWSITSLDGTLSGTIPSGSATWDDGVTQAAIEATFVISEATGEFAGLAGTGRFNGTLSHRSFPPKIGGALTFELGQPPG